MKNTALLIVLLLAAFSCKKEVPDCPEGYTGDNCEEEIQPKSFVITKIYLTAWPLTDDFGTSWDFGSNPDLYVTLSKDLSAPPNYTSPVFQEAELGFTQSWNTSFEFLYNEAVFVQVWDDDGGFTEDDFVGVVFQPYWMYGEGFPILQTHTSGNITINYWVEYRF